MSSARRAPAIRCAGDPERVNRQRRSERQHEEVQDGEPKRQQPALRSVDADGAADPDVHPARQRQGHREHDEKQGRESCCHRVRACPGNRGRSPGKQQQGGRQKQPHPTPGQLENAEKVNVRTHGLSRDSISLRGEARDDAGTGERSANEDPRQ